MSSQQDALELALAELPARCKQVTEHLLAHTSAGSSEAAHDDIPPTLDPAELDDAVLDHLAECDRCRDLRFDLQRCAALTADTALDYQHPKDFELELERRIDANALPGATVATTQTAPLEPAAQAAPSAKVEPARASATPSATASATASAAPSATPSVSPVRPARGARPGALTWRKDRAWLWLSAAAAALVALAVFGPRRSTVHPSADIAGSEPSAETGPLLGRVQAVVRGFGNDVGLQGCESSAPDAHCRTLSSNDTLAAGMLVKTDGLTRARIALNDGTEVSLDRSSSFSLVAGESRESRLLQGDAIFDVRRGLETPFIVQLPLGQIEVLGTKFAVHVEDDAARVDVSRGEVRVADERGRDVRVKAGQTGRLARSRAPLVESLWNVGESFSWNEHAFAPEREQNEPVRGLGELRAKKPGTSTELNGAVTLARHDVRVKLHEAIARTEVEEVFSNNTDETLEGIFRFPLPPDAQIERLALEVDGHWEEGAFVDRDRASAIWRGAIVHATKKPATPRDEIVWVPGPWRDPALLEWQAGGRFELRIFPIPKRGERRVLLTYTQRLEPRGNRVGYTYPLAHDQAGSTRVGNFSVTVDTSEQLGTLHSRGYTLQASNAGYAGPGSSTPDVGSRRYGFSQRDFIPNGDLVLEAELPEAEREVRAWAYQSGDGSGSYVAFALRPNLPAASTGARRALTFVVDRSRSMVGEHFRRASAVVERSIAELDRDALVMVLDCDTTCSSFAREFRPAGAELAREVRRYLDGVNPEGASDLGMMLTRGAQTARLADDRALHVVYIGDGSPSVGPVQPASLAVEVQEALTPQVRVSAVTVGASSDLTALGAVTRAGGGVLVDYKPGQSVSDAAFAVLAATYGAALSQVQVSLPSGLYEMAPRTHGTLLAGQELMVTARLDGTELEGPVTLSGKLGDESFSRSYPLHVVASPSAGNAFVPRWFAAQRISDLEQETGERERVVELSRKYSVASRYTSLLVLESPVMYKAFGIDNQRTQPVWSGDIAASSTTAGELSLAEGKAELALGGDESYEEESNFQDRDSTASRGPSRSARRAPAANKPWPGTRGDELGSGSGVSSKAKSSDSEFAPPPSAPRRDRRPCGCSPDDLMCAMRCQNPGDEWLEPEPRRRMVPMRKIWERTGTVSTDLGLDLLGSSELQKRRQAWDMNPLDREALKRLYAGYLLNGDLERAADLAEQWSAKDPLDPDALTARADIAAQRGDRALSMRILGSVIDVRPGDHAALFRLARAWAWAGDAAQGCRYSVAEAQRHGSDPAALGRALGCLQSTGQGRLADQLSASASDDVRRRAERTPPALSRGLDGDFRVEGSWQIPSDLDLVIVHPDGYRVSWLGAPTQSVISAEDVQSPHREGLALRGAAAGTYAIEVVRGGDEPVSTSGEVEIRIGDQRRRVPFTLHGTRTRIASVKVSMRSRLVPL